MPTITFVPDEVKVGDDYTVEGRGFSPQELVALDILFAAGTVSQRPKADASGAFSARVEAIDTGNDSEGGVLTFVNARGNSFILVPGELLHIVWRQKKKGRSYVWNYGVHKTLKVT
jgi:hypothetical protein